jgi:hypothetical protein
MRARRFLLIALVEIVVMMGAAVFLQACAGSTETSGDAGGPTTTESTQPSSTTSLTGSTSPSLPPTSATEPPTTVMVSPIFEPGNFVSAADNSYFPLKPGATYLFEGRSPEGLSVIEVTVTMDTKEILGVDCAVVRQQLTKGGAITADTIDWFAQDKAGNVWHFGEDTKKYGNGVVVSTAGSWQAGVNGATPGIIMEARPEVGDTYRQGFLQGQAEDLAEVLAVDSSANLPFGSFTRVIKTKEWTPLEPSVVVEKLYAPGLGLVQAKTVQGGTEVENLVQVFEG